MPNGTLPLNGLSSTQNIIDHQSQPSGPGSSYSNKQLIDRLFQQNSSASNSNLLPAGHPNKNQVTNTSTTQSVKKKNSKSISSTKDFVLPSQSVNSAFFS